MNRQSSSNKKLHMDQIRTLELLYKFRFGSNDLLAQYFGKKNGAFVFRRMSVLLGHGLIGKRFEPNFHLHGKPAAYYLLPEGVRALKLYRGPDVADETSIKGIYSDATVSERFIEHCLNVFSLYNRLTERYGDINFLSKADQAGFREDFPKPLPDAYITLESNQTKQFFLDVLDNDTHLLVDASSKMKRYITYRDSGSWTSISGAPFPRLIFVCNSERACQQVRNRCKYLIEKSGIYDITFDVMTSETTAMFAFWDDLLNLP